MTLIYSAQVTATGGRQGTLRSDDGILHVPVATPRSLGGKGDATNPEQLFAAGYAACFGSAMIHLTRDSGFKVRDEDVMVVAKVGLCQDSPRSVFLTAELDVTIRGVTQEQAEEIIRIAHEGCPYSKATRGNLDVKLSVRAV